MNSPESEPKKKRPSHWVSFSRYQLVAVLATGIDFLTLILLTEFAGLWYLFSAVTGAVFGAITAFLLGRYWVFESVESRTHHQAFRYAIVAVGSVVLNSYGVYFFTDIIGLQYIFSKAITAIVVSVGYNYLLSKNFVFK